MDVAVAVVFVMVEIKTVLFGIEIAKSIFLGNQALLSVMNHYVWSAPFNGVEVWTLGRVAIKRLGTLEYMASMYKVSCTERKHTLMNIYSK